MTGMSLFRRNRLPRSRYVFATWGVRVDSGGMTIALLRRAKNFVAAGVGEVSILTFDNVTDYPAIEAELRDLGRMVDGVSIVNIWDWLRTETISLSPKSKRTPRAELLIPITESDTYTSTWRGDTEWSRARFAEDGTTVLQVDYLRPDGTLLASDRRDARERGTLGKRWITICDMRGNAFKSFSKATPFYHWVLDRMFKKERVTLMIDSKTAANPLISYRRATVLTVYVVHGAHTTGENEEGRIKLIELRHNTIRELHEFDLVTVLTKHQRQDLVTLLGPVPNVAVVPNATALPTQPPVIANRPRAAGAWIGIFEPRKHASLAIEAVALARESHAVTLDVFGDGEDMPVAVETRERLNAEPFVHLHGYTSDAAHQLIDKSFLLVTSETEGMGLVLLEAMAVGCIPISFDIRYGPSDLITPGKTGFLIAPGDVQGMADQITALQELPEQQVLALRRQAMRVVKQFSDERVTQLWAAELSKAWRRKSARWWSAVRNGQKANAERMLDLRQPVIEPTKPLLSINS